MCFSIGRIIIIIIPGSTRALRRLRARASAQLRRKMLKFNINAILQIKKLQTVITREEKTKKAAEKKAKEKIKCAAAREEVA